MKVITLSKSIVYIIVGILVLIFNTRIYDYLHYVIGGIYLALSFEGLLYDIFTKKYRVEHNHIGNSLIGIALSLLIIIHPDFYLVCIVWATISLLKGGKEISEAIYHIVNSKAKKYSIISLLEALAMVALAILLMENPHHHVKMHIIILGIEFILEGIRRILHVLETKYAPHNIEAIENVIEYEDLVILEHLDEKIRHEIEERHKK